MLNIKKFLHQLNKVETVTVVFTSIIILLKNIIKGLVDLLTINFLYGKKTTYGFQKHMKKN